MGRKRKSTSVTRKQSSKIFCGNPSPLNKTEPPTLRQLIQYSYFLRNSQPDMSDYAIAKLITKDVIAIWQAVNPRLPIHSEYYILKQVNTSCFMKAKAVNRKSLSTRQIKNLQEKLDKLFDISTCLCSLPILPCEDQAVKCNVENCQMQHIVCSCPSERKVPIEEREYLRD